jgi:peptidoglycan/xylan/chitin deacetylase (PgdA/CDA1 family)
VSEPPARGSPGVAAPAAPPGRWRPPAALRASAWLHAGAAAGALASPEHWPWAAAAVAANHAAIAAAGFAPRSALIGDNLSRLPPRAALAGQLALTFDDGPDPEMTPRVLDALAAARCPATFFCVGERASRHPALLRRMVAEGHAVENHSHRHASAFAWGGPRRLGDEIDAAQQAILQAAGVAPRFFRAPFGIRTALLDPVLARRGLRYASWSVRGYDTVAHDAARVLRRLRPGVVAGAVVLLHDGRATGGRPGRAASVAPALLPQLLALLAARGLVPVTLRAAVDAERLDAHRLVAAGPAT